MASGAGNVLPTRVGMVRCRWDRTIPMESVLPTRVGMVRVLLNFLLGGSEFSPRVWGWSDRRKLSASLPHRFPHACGDGPEKQYADFLATGMFSPRVWGWSVNVDRHVHSSAVLPTRVGMVHIRGSSFGCRARSPHACGDGPAGLADLASTVTFSPSVWGWSAVMVGANRPSFEHVEV